MGTEFIKIHELTCDVAYLCYMSMHTPLVCRKAFHNM